MTFLRHAILSCLVAMGSAIDETVEESNVNDGKSNDMNKFDNSLFLFLILSIFTVWLLYHSVVTAIALFPAIKEFFPKKASGPRNGSAADDAFVNKKAARRKKDTAQEKPAEPPKKARAPTLIYEPALIKKVAIALVGWCVFSVSSNALGSQMGHLGTFDPYNTLGVSSSDSPRDIKRAFRKLSLKWHPDKNKVDDPKVVKREFMKINKAYKIIFKQAKGEKLENHDFQMDLEGAEYNGIGLPSFMANANVQTIMVVCYGSFFAVGLPFIFFKLQGVFKHDKVSSGSGRGGFQNELNDMAGSFEE